MSIKTVLTHVEPDWGSGRALEVAIEVAKMFSAHITGLGAEAIDPALYGYAEGTLIQALRDQIKDDAASAEQRFRSATASLGADASWLYQSTDPVDAVVACARGADLVVAHRTGASAGRGNFCAVGDLVLRAGAPVLVAPEEGPPLTGKRVLFAWRDGREARRALSDALPFLKRADHVMLSAVCSADARDQVEAELKDVVRRLTLHDVRVVRDLIPSGHGEASSKLIDAAHRFNADLIVAGAYGHVRLREWALGGVTQDLLDRCSKYVLFSH
ncbi:MAG TPA: universal stress protein [Caulobacteraceae bacterium]|nr:universal stress protein [Caulobacteraceae bacterium]